MSAQPSDEWTGTGAGSLTQGPWESLCNLHNKHVSRVSTVPTTRKTKGSALDHTHSSNVICCSTRHLGPDRTFGTGLTFRTGLAAAGAGRKADPYRCVSLDAGRLTPMLRLSESYHAFGSATIATPATGYIFSITTVDTCMFPGHTDKVYAWMACTHTEKWRCSMMLYQ